MINILLGPMGAGKSFEAVVFHVLPALRKGRKVITNLPLNLEELAKLSKNYLPLISLRHNNHEVVEEKSTWNMFHKQFDKFTIKTSYRPFASMADYGDEWRHPVNGCGPLYVIDECHKAIPAKGTPLDVQEWFAEHRHEFADVLLITQTIGKCCKAIYEPCQVVYRCRKAVAFGLNTAYTRNVQDGLKGEVVNTSLRKYKPEFFKFYKSHTRTEGGGTELEAVDLVPFWKRWPVVGAGICFTGVLALLLTGHSINPMKSAFATPAKNSKDVVIPIYSIAPLPASAVIAVSPSSAPLVVGIQSAPVSSGKKMKQEHPFDGLTFHIVSFIESATKWRYSFSLDQNGQPTTILNQTDLEKSGYTVDKLSDCSAKIHYGEISFFVVCDTQSVALARGLAGNY